MDPFLATSIKLESSSRQKVWTPTKGWTSSNDENADPNSSTDLQTQATRRTVTAPNHQFARTQQQRQTCTEQMMLTDLSSCPMMSFSREKTMDQKFINTYGKIIATLGSTFKFPKKAK